jgi:hypothetical protein
MSDLEQAARQALDALKKADKISGYVNNNNKTAIKVLEAALQQQAEPVAEPLTWLLINKTGARPLIYGDAAPPAKQAESHKRATDADNGQSMTQADSGNPSF